MPSTLGGPVWHPPKYKSAHGEIAGALTISANYLLDKCTTTARNCKRKIEFAGGGVCRAYTGNLLVQVLQALRSRPRQDERPAHRRAVVAGDLPASCFAGMLLVVHLPLPSEL